MQSSSRFFLERKYFLGATLKMLAALGVLSVWSMPVAADPAATIGTISAITYEDVSPTIVVSVAGDTFKYPAVENVGNWTFDGGDTDLTISSITAGDVSPTEVLIAFSGTAKMGFLTIKANSAALTSGGGCNDLIVNIKLPPVPTNLSFVAVYGETPDSQTFNLVVPSDVSPTDYLLGSTQLWLSVTNAQGDVSGTIPSDTNDVITVTIVPDAVSPTELSVGRHSGNVTVGSNWLNVAVEFDVVLRPDPTNLVFNTRFGETDPIILSFNLVVPSDVSPTDYLLGSTKPSWLTATNSEGTVSGTIPTDGSTNITVAVLPDGLSVGVTNGTISVGPDWLNVTVVVNVERGNDAIWFGGTNQTYSNGQPRIVTATSTHANAVTVTYDGSAVPPSNAGTYIVTGIVDAVSWTGTNTATLTVAKATPDVTTWPVASEITYGDALSDSELTGGVSSVPGVFAFVSSGTTPDVGTFNAEVKFTPTDAGNYNTVNGVVDVTVLKATPAVTIWPVASEITYGDALSDSELTGGVSSVPGVFAFVSPGTTPDVGTFNAEVKFTPTDAGKYNPVVGNVVVTVNKANQTITFTAIQDQVVTSAVTLIATSDSGLTVNFTATGPATITSGNILTFSGAGVVTIVAAQEGDANWNAAEDVTVSFNVHERELQFLAADFDGDGKADPTQYEMSSGSWKILLSSTEYTRALCTGLLGGADWVAVAADFDGDGKADPAVYRESDGKWMVRLSGSEYGKVVLQLRLGGAGYSAIPADYDGDGLADLCVYQRATGDWQVRLSTLEYDLLPLANLLGETAGKVVPADYDGDGLADPAIYRENGKWAIMMSQNEYSKVISGVAFGGPGYLAVPADYDGDGKADLAIKNEANNEWTMLLSSLNYEQVTVTLLFE